MKIRVWVKDLTTGETLEELGTCVTDSPHRAIQMYNQDEVWEEKGYIADIAWEDITNEAARALGSIKSERKAATSAANGKKGGRPKRMLIKAQRDSEGRWGLVGDNGDRPQEGFAYATQDEAYQAAAQLWPTNSVWRGRKVARGYSIDIE